MVRLRSNANVVRSVLTTLVSTVIRGGVGRAVGLLDARVSFQKSDMTLSNSSFVIIDQQSRQLLRLVLRSDIYTLLRSNGTDVYQ